MQSRINVYQMVTDKVIEQLSKGIVPWQKSWIGCTDMALNYITRKPYSLLNQIMLGQSGEYLTFNQVKSLKGHVKKGAKAKIVVFFQMVEDKKNTKINENGDKETALFPILRYYNVFHISDCEGIESKVKTKGNDKIAKADRLSIAEDTIKRYLDQETHLLFQNDKESNKAYYSPVLDEVVVPQISQFSNIEEYYSTVFHEFIHSTGIKSRLNRENAVGNHFGDQNYSREELVAELGSVMICNQLGIDTEKSFVNSVAYLQSWIDALENDNKMIVWAASRAEKAADFIIFGRVD